MIKNHNSEKINIGKVTGAVGLRGEVSIFHHADDSDMMQKYESLIISGEVFDIENIRYRKKTPILKLSGISDRNEAEALIKKDIFVEKDKIPELADGNYYIKDLLGLNVISALDGSSIGILKNVMSGAAQDTYEIETVDGKTMLLPAVTEFINEISLKEKTIKVSLPDGIEDVLY